MKLHVQTLFVAIGLGIKRNWHIFLAIIAGVIFGNFIHENPGIFTTFVKILNLIGQAFIRVIQMVVIPLVCSAIVVGISSIGDSKQIGKRIYPGVDRRRRLQGKAQRNAEAPCREAGKESRKDGAQGSFRADEPV